MLTNILSWLLHHANRNCNDEIFYQIKNKILKRFGKFICYDVQFIEGKKCYCGDGIYGYDWYGNIVECYKCNGTGWYKKPVWNILSKIKFGKYEFHQPYAKVFKKPDNSIHIINGYIDHNFSDYGKFALIILYLVYDFSGFWKRWYKSIGTGWRLSWWLPKNYINNIFHLIKKRQRAFPIVNLKEKYYFFKLRYVLKNCDLPF